MLSNWHLVKKGTSDSKKCQNVVNQWYFVNMLLRKELQNFKDLLNLCILLKFPIWTSTKTWLVRNGCHVEEGWGCGVDGFSEHIREETAAFCSSENQGGVLCGEMRFVGLSNHRSLRPASSGLWGWLIRICSWNRGQSNGRSPKRRPNTVYKSP